MATDILLPKIGFSMDEGKIAEWHVKDGDTIKEGELLYTLEADKSANDVEAPATGIVRIQKEAGEVYQVGTVLGKIE